jgi:hypothetical protein
MAKLTDEELRALLLLARSPNGCTEALLMAHGFPTEMLEGCWGEASLRPLRRR